ncbi:substrate-binding domain-containing protein [Geoglobus sp.]
MRNVAVIAGVVVIAIALAFVLQHNTQSEVRVLTISTTTSLYDTGLLEEAIAPAFKEKYGIELHFIPKGTGAAIQDAKNGVSDAIMVHARSKEIKFMEGGYGVNRKVFAYNFFVIVGPEDDPAGIKGLTPVEALKKIVQAGREGKAIWVSRDDGSGTNTKEIALWKMAGFDYSKIKNESWFVATGTGMGATLNYANTKKAYTLSDTGTFLKYRKEGLIDLVALVDKGEELINVYAIILINPEKFDKDFEGAKLLANWLTGEEGQRIIGEFGKDKFGKPLFYPIVDVLKEKKEPYFDWIVKYGLIEDGGKVTECPEKFRYGEGMTFFEFG